jgi:hypothetical protein
MSVLAATLTQPKKRWYLGVGRIPSHAPIKCATRTWLARAKVASCSSAEDGRRTYLEGETRPPIFRELRSIFKKNCGTDSHSSHSPSTFREQDRLCLPVQLESAPRRACYERRRLDDHWEGGTLGPSRRPSQKSKNPGAESEVTNYSEHEFRRRIAEVDRFLTRRGRVFLLHVSASGDIGLHF